MSSAIEPQPRSSSEKQMAPTSSPRRSIQVSVAIVRFFVPIAILAMAALAAFLLIDTRPAAPRIELAARPTLVEIYKPETRDERIIITGFGTVEPYRQLTVQPQVGGLVETVNSALITGGLLRKGGRSLPN